MADASVNWVANLTNGLYGAIVGGVVAALTAWGVFAATKRLERHRVTELEAREAARSLILETQVLVTTFLDDASHGTTLRVLREQLRLKTMLAAYAPAIANVDQSFAAELDTMLDDLYRRMGRVTADSTSPENQERIGEVGGAIAWFVRTLSEWLANRRPEVSPRRRNRPRSLPPRSFG